MRIIKLSDLKTIDFTVCGVKSFYQKPVYRRLDIKHRHPNGFLHIEKGECRYSSDAGEIELVPGSLVYLPIGSSHTLEVFSETIEFTRIDFTIRDEEGEICIFSACPLLITHSTSPECRKKIARLSDVFRHTADKLASKKLICSILGELAEHPSEAYGVSSGEGSRVAPCVMWINENFCEDMSGEKLAELCYMSKVQMYRLFRNEVGCSPTVYRNRLRIERACKLLRSELSDTENSEGVLSVSEIAEFLGFDSIYYFSRMFKKYMGISPTEYREVVT